MEILTIPLDPSVVTWHFNCVLFSLCKSKWKKNGFYGKFHLKIYGTSEFLGFLSSYFVKKLFDCQTKFSCLAQNFLIVSVIIVSVEWAVAPGWPIKSHRISLGKEIISRATKPGVEVESWLWNKVIIPDLRQFFNVLFSMIFHV